MVEEFRRSIMAELDYRLEVANLRLLGANLAGYDLLVVPQPVDDYTTSVVLTMDLVDGRNVGSLGTARPSRHRRHSPRGAAVRRLSRPDPCGRVRPHRPPPGERPAHLRRSAGADRPRHGGRVGPDLQDALVRLLLALSEGHGNDVAAVMAGLGEKRDSWDALRFEREIVSLVQQHQSVVVGQLESGRWSASWLASRGNAGCAPRSSSPCSARPS